MIPIHIFGAAVLATAAAAEGAALPFQKRGKTYTIPFAAKRTATQAPATSSFAGLTGIQRRQDNNSNGDVSQLLNDNDVRYIASVTIAGQNLDLILDTGSTDTFVYSVAPDSWSDEEDQSTLPPLFDNSTAQGVTYLGLTYNASYGSDGDVSTLGAIGLAPVSLDGTDLSVPNLTFANLYSSSGSTGASGLVGLGFPLGGDIFNMVLEAFDQAGQPLTQEQATAYYPLVPRLQAIGQIDKALFSIIVDRIPASEVAPSDLEVFNYTSSQGTLTIGNYPDNFTESDFTFLPVPTVEASSRATAIGYPSQLGNRWTTALQNIYFNGKLLQNTTLSPSFQDDQGYLFALIDSGNAAMGLPSDVISQITSAYALNPSGDTLPCDTPFELVFQFGGQNFTMAPGDVLVPSYQAVDAMSGGDFATTDCQFNAQPSDPTPDEFGPYTSVSFMLGDPFLRNVAIVFDYGSLLDASSAPRIGLAQRT